MLFDIKSSSLEFSALEPSHQVVKAPELGMYFDRAVDHGLSSFYRGLNKAVVRGTRFNISIPVPELGKVVNISIYRYW